MFPSQLTPNLSTHIPKVSPHGAWFSGIGNCPACRQLLPVAPKFGVVFAAQRDGVVGAWRVVRAVRHVRRHERQPLFGTQHGMHDLVLLGGVFTGMELSERADGQLTPDTDW